MTLAAGDQLLEADFELTLSDLPFTGSPNWTIAIAQLAAALLCAGAGVVLIGRSAPRLWRRVGA